MKEIISIYTVQCGGYMWLLSPWNVASVILIKFKFKYVASGYCNE